MDTPSTISLLSEISDATEEDLEELQPSLSCASISTQIQNVHPNINQWRDCYSAWQQFDLFRKADLFTDIELKVKDYSFKAHKAVLSACSEYFKALFTGEWPSKKVLVYEEIKPEIMKQIIEWAYTREVKVDSDNVTDLLPTADRFGCTAIVKSCSDLLNSELSAENCLGIRAFALFYFQNELFKAAESFTLRNFEDVSKTSQEFFDIEPPVLYEFLASDELNVRSEEIAFEALMTWVTAKEEDRKDMLANMLQSIRMGLMDPEYFMASVKNHSLIHNNPKVRPIVKESMKALYDLSTTSTSALNQPRVNNPFIRPRFPHQILMAIGGWSGGSPTNAVETYDCRAEQWTNITANECFNNERPRAYHGTICTKKYIYMIGGFDGQNYFNSMRKIDLIKRKQSEEPPMKHRRCYVAVAMAKGYIYAIGGMDGQQRLDACERFHIRDRVWEELPKMSEKRSDADATSINDRVYIAGGFNGHECLSSIEYFDEDTFQWTRITPMRTRRSGISIIGMQNKIYAVGGFDGVNRLRTAECYEAETNSWKAIANMINPRSNFGIEVIDQQIVAVGGFNGFQTTFNVEAYDQETDEWYELADMSIFRSALACCVVSDLPIEDMKRYAAPRTGMDSRERVIPHFTQSSLSN